MNVIEEIIKRASGVRGTKYKNPTTNIGLKANKKTEKSSIK